MKYSKRIIALILSVMTIISVGTMTTLNVFAADSKKYAEDVKKAVAMAEAQPVVPDKGVKASAASTTGKYPTRKGTIVSTNTNASLGGATFVGHAAIVYSASTVVESLGNGVTIGKNNWNSVKTKCWGLSVVGTTTSEDTKAANWCYKKIGCPYNYNFLNVSTRSKFYCSQLVWASFYDLFDVDLNTSTLGKIVTPMELVNSENTNVIYKKS